MFEGGVRATKSPVEVEVQMKNLLRRFWKEEEGQDLTEYALLITLIALASVVSMGTLAKAISTVFSNASTSLS